MIYIAEVRNSDGNDVEVLDVLIAAVDRAAAHAQLRAWMAETWPRDESDGEDGTYHPCDCVCEHVARARARRGSHVATSRLCMRCARTWECSHGGLLIAAEAALEEYATLDAARANLRAYHRCVDLTPA